MNLNHVSLFSREQIAFTQTSAQEKAEQATAKSTAHTDLDDEEETGHAPKPVPLSSPSHIVRKWMTASPLDIMKLNSHGSAHKVHLILVSEWDNC